MRLACERRGFTIVELMVVMAITMFVLVAASRVMISMVSQFKTQSKIAESSLESSFGVELLRRDISRAGFGLPYGIAQAGSDKIYQEFDWAPLTGYAEVSSAAPSCPQCANAATFNDSSSTGKKPPRPVLVGNPSTPYTVNKSDYFVIKSVALGDQYAAGKIHLLEPGNIKNKWYKDNDTEDKDTKAFRDSTLRNTDWVMVLSMRDTTIKGLGLVRDGADFTIQYNNTLNYSVPATSTSYETRVVMGLTDDGTKPRAPFNRADYYITKSLGVPSQCAPGTGVLVKSVMQHGNGALGAPIPIMDCVADFQIVFGLDTDGNGELDTSTDSLLGMTAADIRAQVKVISAYILTHEGQQDPKYDFSQTSTPASSKIRVGEGALGREFDLNLNFDNQDLEVKDLWKRYRWRVMRVTEKPTAIE